MPYIDRQNGELVIRIVYDGSPEAGKTTNVQALSTLLSMQRRGQVVAPGTTSRRTEFFDWLDFSGGYVDGRRLRCQLVSVPGQPSLLRRRRYLLESADAVVFVADSHPLLVEESRQSFRQLREMLVRVEGELPIGVVLQANKQDRPNALTPSALANRLAVGATVPVVGARAHEAEGVRESFLLASRLATERVRALLARESVAETGLGSAESLHEAMLAHGLGALLEERTDARVVPMARASTAPVVLRATLDDHVGRPSELELAFAAATVAADVVGADAAAAHAADVETDATAAHAADDTTEGPGADDPTAPDLELEADDDYLALELRPLDAAEVALDARADDEVDAADELAGETVDDVDVVDVGDHDDVHVGVAVTEPDAGCAAYADPLEPSSNHGPEARHAPDLAARAPAEGDSCAPSAPHETPVAGELSSRPPPCETPQPAIGDLPPGVELPPSSEVIGDLPPGVELPPASELPPGCAWPPVHGRALYTAATLGALTRRERRPWAPRDAIELCSDRGLLLHTCDRWQVPELESARRSLLEVVRALVPWTSVLPEERALILAPTRDGWTIWMISPAAPTLADALASAAVDDLDELLLFDIRLAGPLDGVEAARRIQAERRTPVVFLSAFDDDETLERVRRVPHSHYLLKPFDPRLLQITLDAVLFKFEAEQAQEREERRRRALEHRLAVMLDQSRDAIVSLDDDLRVVVFNRGASEVLLASAAIEPPRRPSAPPPAMPTAATATTTANGASPRSASPDGASPNGTAASTLADDALAALSGREREVVTLVVEARSVREIAKQLFISEHTVRNHLRAIYAKLDVHSRVELVRRVMGTPPR